MKQFKTLVALVLALALTMTLVGSAFADVTITVDQDSSYAGTAGEAGRTLTYYKVFSAVYGDDFTGNSSHDGGYVASGNNAGDAGTVAGDTTHPVAYVALPDVAAKLGTIDATTHAWTTNAGNQWFDLTYTPGTGNYSVSWRNGVEKTTANTQAAAAWLIANAVYEAGKTGNLTWNSTNTNWSATVEPGYYVLSSSTGDNLIAATTNVDIKEKNAYPPLDKTQADEDNTTQNDNTRKVAVGDVLDYEVKVTIPATAKVGDQILVWDKPTRGLTYNNNVAVKNGSNTGNATVTTANYTGTDADPTWSWSRVITVTEGSQGTDVVFAFSMTVNDSALVDTGKENESGLKYGREGDWKYDSIPDHVEYKTYFGGIEKVDGAETSVKLANVEFTLKEDGNNFYVKPVMSTGETPTILYYIACASNATGATTTVKTDAAGQIRIRGLDEDKIYTLTETLNPNAGYNMLAAPVTLTLHEDTYTVVDDNGNETTTSSYDGATVDTWQDVVNNKGSILPSTGGIGTTIFYIAGIVLVLGAAAIIIARRKAEQN